MPSNNKIETILLYIKNTTLAGINAGTNYFTTPKIISREFKKPEETPEFPALYIVKDKQTKIQQFTDIVDNKEYTRGVLSIIIIGYIQNKLNQDTEINKLYRDVEKIMLADITLGGNACFVEIKNVEFQQGADIESNAFCWFKAFYEIIYEDKLN